MAVSAVKKEPPKPKQSEPAPQAEAAGPAPSGKKGRKLLFIALALTVLGAGGGGAWWYRHHDAGLSASKAEPSKPPMFAPLDMFTVNLQPEDGQQFAQVGLTLRVTDEGAVAALKLRMPEIRDRILLLLSAKKPSELISVEGKRKLSAEIHAAVNEILVPGSAQAQKSAAKPAAAAPEATAQAEAREATSSGQAEPAAESPPAAQESAAAEAAPGAAAAQPLPVTGVLFTSFIIQ